jgi:hypothetical protein
MLSPATDVTGRRLWRNKSWVILDGNPQSFVGNFMIYPLRHAPTRESLTEDENRDLDEIIEFLELESENVFVEVLSKLGLGENSLGGHRCADVENGHFGFFMEPTIYSPAGLKTLEDHMVAAKAVSLRNNGPEIHRRFVGRIAQQLSLHRWERQ